MLVFLNYIDLVGKNGMLDTHLSWLYYNFLFQNKYYSITGWYPGRILTMPVRLKPDYMMKGLVNKNSRPKYLKQILVFQFLKTYVSVIDLFKKTISDVKCLINDQFRGLISKSNSILELVSG